jgi:hypothetical protein
LLSCQEIPRILGNPNAESRVHSNPPVVPILSQTNPIHTLPSHSLRSISILSSHLYHIARFNYRLEQRLRFVFGMYSVRISARSPATMGFSWFSPVPAGKSRESTSFRKRSFLSRSFLIHLLPYHSTLYSTDTEDAVKQPAQHCGPQVGKQLKYVAVKLKEIVSKQSPRL